MYKTIERRLKRLEAHRVNTITYEICGVSVTVPNTRTESKRISDGFIKAVTEYDENAGNAQK